MNLALLLKVVPLVIVALLAVIVVVPTLAQLDPGSAHFLWLATYVFIAAVAFLVFLAVKKKPAPKPEKTFKEL